MIPLRFLLLTLILPGILAAQQGAPAGVGDSKAATGGAKPGQMNEGFIGRDVPHFDPGNDTMAYDGKLWNINDNRLFRARFEKYLAAIPATDEADVTYRKTIEKIMDLLTPGKMTKQSFDEAFGLLKKASQYKDDANLCSTLSDAIYTAQVSLQQIEILKQENTLLERQRTQAEWNNEIAAKDTSLTGISGKENSTQLQYRKDERDARMARPKRQLSEVGQTIQNNKLRMASLEVAAKGQMQCLIMQFFGTRRFQHTIIANRFYRAICTNGDSNSIELYKKMVNQLPTNKDAGQAKFNAEFNPQVSSEAKGGTVVQGAGAGTNGANAGGSTYVPQGQSFSAQGMKMGVENVGVESLVGGAANAAQAISKLISSLSQIDAFADEAIREINEGVDAYKFLLSQNELKSATERLAETFALGEFMPSVRLLSRDDKRRALIFSQKGNKLLACLEVNDLTGAEKLVLELQQMAGDFDASKPLAKIETAKVASQMHLAKARNAAASGNTAGMEAELRAAGEIWPRNPALQEVGSMILNQSDVQQNAIRDFDQLVSQKNYRQIYDDKMRFMAAVVTFPEKQEQLKKILEDMSLVDAAIIRAQEIEKRGDAAGAWESVESAAKKFPDDNKLNQARANLTTKASDFVRTFKQAEEQEKNNQPGSALAGYLKALKQYPASDFAKDGIHRISLQFLPDAN